MQVDAEELIGRTAASLMFLDIVPDLIPREGRRSMVGLPINTRGAEFRALFVADEDEPILRLLVFLKPAISDRSTEHLLTDINRANTQLQSGAFFLQPTDSTVIFYTSALLGADDPLPTKEMIHVAKAAIERFLPAIRGLH